MKKLSKSSLAVLLALVMIFSVMSPISAFAVTVDKSKLGSDTYLTSKTDYTVAPGITESHVTTNNGAGSNQVQGYALEVDLSNPTTSIIASYKDYDPTKGWGMQKVRDQAYAAEAKLGVNVVAGVNGDFFNMGTGQPTGTFVMNGTVYNTNNNWNYFAILKDGTPVIGSGKLDTSNVKECVGGPCIIVKDGKITNESEGYSRDQMPRTAVGITAEGKVILWVADGRQAPMSCGQNGSQLAQSMLALGCVDALCLDGGGSTTFVSQHEGSDELVCRNSPSDGSERTVSSALLVCSSAKPTGEFDHASLSPKSEIYTPSSSVTLSAIGVDSAGAGAPLPEDGQFALADSSFGTIADGVFTSNGKLGEVVINYVTSGAVAGSTTIEIREPDTLAFEKEEINLAFDQESDLGLLATYQGRPVNTKAGDFTWVLDDAKMGTFNGNTFVASPTESINGNITVTSVYDSSVTASIYAIIGRQPYVVWDFEDVDYYTFATGYLNANGGIATYLTGDSSCNMLLGTYVNGDGTPRGARGTAEVVDFNNGEVRLGSHSLKINYDFTNQGEDKIDGVCIGAYSPTSSMEGTPTAIGLWLYAPEGTPNFWFRIRVWDAGANNGKGAVQTLNFTVRGDSKPADGVGGINWQGWKYCEAQLSGVGPFSLLGGECVRLMNCVNYSQNGNKTVTGGTNADGTLAYKTVARADRKGYVYIDNVQFVYGSNTQDTDNPVIDSMTVGNATTGETKEIGTDTTITTNDIVLQANFHDVQNKFATGIDYENKAYGVYVDGKNVTADPNCIVLPGDDIIKYYATLADGTHSVKILLRDGFGNETVETRYFTVNGGVSYPTVKVEAADASCVLNKTYTVDLKTNAPDSLTGLTANVKVDNDIVASADAITVSYADGFTGTYTYDAEKGVIALNVSGTAASDAEWATVASITFSIPSDVAEGKSFTYRVLEGSIAYSDASIVTDTFASAEIATPVEETYSIVYDTILVGSAGANISVKNADGSAAAGVGLYKTDGSLLGTTDADGHYFSNEFTSSAQSITLYANLDGDYSFRTTSQSFVAGGTEDGKPMSIISVATDNASTSKELSWFASPVASAEKAVVQYAEKSAYDANGEAAFKTAEGTSTIYNYTGSTVENNRSARINNVTITGLKEGTEYVYRCGDGAIWSDVKSFKTSVAKTNTSFFLIGDIQAEDMTYSMNVAKKIASDGTDYTFGIQTGDAIETSSIYSLWTDVLGVFTLDGIQDTDMIHVYGNHELIGDSTGLSSKLLYGLDDTQHKYYSVTYGNVYAAVINFQETNTEEEFLEALEWLKADAKASDAQWKILSIHSPVYNTNLDAYIEWEYNYLPAAVQEAGICAVFSGHDHSYSRTKPMTDGQVDEENGVVYFICGNTGEKSYSTVITPDYNFDAFTPRSEYTGIYLSVTTTDTEMTITTYDVVGDTSNIIDSTVIKRTVDCTENGHDYLYADGQFTCSVCGYKIAAAESDYVGLVTDEATGLPMYFINGTPKTGWLSLGEDNYCFDDNGIARTGKVKIDGHTYTFGEDGKMTLGSFEKNSDGTYSYYINGQKQRGWFMIDGDWYYFSRTNGFKTLSGTKSVNGLTYTFASDGKLIGGAWNTTEQGTCYYWGPYPVTGLQTIDGYRYYFNPEDTYMVVNDTVEIDGKIYAFDEEGKFMHYDEHVDRNNDGKCDECTVKSPLWSFLQMLISFFQKIKAFFMSLFA